MKALLILNAQNGNAKVVVKLKDKEVKRRVISLLEDDRVSEAFEMLKREGEVELFLPAGKKLPIMPRLTLVEELIRK
jgi:hypothetical protein